MALTYAPVHLSGSTDGLPIKVVATATAGTLIHTSVTGTSSFDKVWMWVSNTSGSAATLTFEWGGATDPDNLLVKALSIPANSGPTLIADGLLLNNAKVIRAFSGTANVLNVVGHVTRGT